MLPKISFSFLINEVERRHSRGTRKTIAVIPRLYTFSFISNGHHVVICGLPIWNNATRTRVSEEPFTLVPIWKRSERH